MTTSKPSSWQRRSDRYQEDVRRIALSLPQTSEGADHFGFSALNKGKLKGFAWAWNERIEPKKPRVPNPEVLAVRIAWRCQAPSALAAELGRAPQ
jgi:hypothetical protein